MRFWRVIIIFFFIIIIGFSLFVYELQYVKKLHVSGVIEKIEWEPELNHNLPRFTIKLDSGEIVQISHVYIKLDREDVQAGDTIFKEKNSLYCLINGNKILFARENFSFNSIFR